MEPELSVSVVEIALDLLSHLRYALLQTTAARYVLRSRKLSAQNRVVFVAYIHVRMGQEPWYPESGPLLASLNWNLCAHYIFIGPRGFYARTIIDARTIMASRGLHLSARIFGCVHVLVTISRALLLCTLIRRGCIPRRKARYSLQKGSSYLSPVIREAQCKK